MVHSIAWNDAANILCGIQDSQLTVWYYPSIVFTDKDLIPKTLHLKDGGWTHTPLSSLSQVDLICNFNAVCVVYREFGQTPQILSFVGTTVMLRQRDGSLVPSSVPHYPTMLHEYSTSARWEDAVQLCRFANVRPPQSSVWDSEEKISLPSFSISYFFRGTQTQR